MHGVRIPASGGARTPPARRLNARGGQQAQCCCIRIGCLQMCRIYMHILQFIYCCARRPPRGGARTPPARRPARVGGTTCARDVLQRLENENKRVKHSRKPSGAPHPGSPLCTSRVAQDRRTEERGDKTQPTGRARDGSGAHNLAPPGQGRVWTARDRPAEQLEPSGIGSYP